jgi:hypothetical protein
MVRIVAFSIEITYNSSHLSTSTSRLCLPLPPTSTACHHYLPIHFQYPSTTSPPPPALTAYHSSFSNSHHTMPLYLHHCMPLPHLLLPPQPTFLFTFHQLPHHATTPTPLPATPSTLPATSPPFSYHHSLPLLHIHHTMLLHLHHCLLLHPTMCHSSTFTSCHTMPLHLHHCLPLLLPLLVIPLPSPTTTACHFSTFTNYHIIPLHLHH